MVTSDREFEALIASWMIFLASSQVLVFLLWLIGVIQWSGWVLAPIVLVVATIAVLFLIIFVLNVYSLIKGD
jgi:hypothetical protein